MCIMGRKISLSLLLFVWLINLAVSYSIEKNEFSLQQLETLKTPESKDSKKNISPSPKQNPTLYNTQQPQPQPPKNPNPEIHRQLFLSNSSNQTCGDSTKSSEQQCDDGNLINGDGCNINCQLEYCGDSIVTGQEECDDGNTINNDGCSNDCKLEICGDQRIRGGEECDDGNMDDGDGCSSDCKLQGLLCGNGRIQGLEQCDDGNTKNDDGCSTNCRIQLKSVAVPLAVGITVAFVAISILAVTIYKLTKPAVSAAAGGATGMPIRAPQTEKYLSYNDNFDTQ